MYYKIDKYTQQRVVLSTTTVHCDIDDAVRFLLDPASRFQYDTQLGVSCESLLVIRHIVYQHK